MSQTTLDFKPGTQWMTAYQRNNKSKGQKNLRCFPMCTEKQGHQAGFCGRCVRVNFTVALDQNDLVSKSPETIAEEYLCFAQFIVIDVACETFEVGDFISNAHFLEHLRTQTSQLGQFIEGYPEEAFVQHSNLQITYEINRKLNGWHYGFKGSKKTRNFFHKLCVFTCKVQPDRDGMVVLNKVLSPEWQMFCRRRKSAPVPEQVMQPTLHACCTTSNDKVTRKPLNPIENTTISNKNVMMPQTQTELQGNKNGISLRLKRSNSINQKMAKLVKSNKPRRKPVNLKVDTKQSSKRTTKEADILSPANLTKKLHSEIALPGLVAFKTEADTSVKLPEAPCLEFSPTAGQLPAPPALNVLPTFKSNNLYDNRFELLRKIFRETNIPHNCTLPKDEANILEHVDAFLRHCYDLRSNSEMWTIPYHVQWAGTQHDHLTEFALFLTKQTAFLEAVQNRVCQADCFNKEHDRDRFKFLFTLLEEQTKEYWGSSNHVASPVRSRYCIQTIPESENMGMQTMDNNQFPLLPHSQPLVHNTLTYPTQENNTNNTQMLPPRLNISAVNEEQPFNSLLQTLSPMSMDMNIMGRLSGGFVRGRTNSMSSDVSLAAPALGSNSLNFFASHARRLSNSSLQNFTNSIFVEQSPREMLCSPRNGGDEWKDGRTFDFEMDMQHDFGKLSIDRVHTTRHSLQLH